MDICKFRACFSVYKPAIFRRAHPRYIFPTTSTGSVHTNSRRSTGKQNMRSRKRKIGKWGRGETRIQSIVHVIFARRFGSRPTFIKSDRQREHSHRNERLPGERVKEHILRNIATAAAAAADSTRVGGRRYRSTVRDKNRRYEEYRRRPVECSPVNIWMIQLCAPLLRWSIVYSSGFNAVLAMRDHAFKFALSFRTSQLIRL